MKTLITLLFIGTVAGVVYMYKSAKKEDIELVNSEEELNEIFI